MLQPTEPPGWNRFNVFQPGLPSLGTTEAGGQIILCCWKLSWERSDVCRGVSPGCSLPDATSSITQNGDTHTCLNIATRPLGSTGPGRELLGWWLEATDDVTKRPMVPGTAGAAKNSLAQEDTGAVQPSTGHVLCGVCSPAGSYPIHAS